MNKGPKVLIFGRSGYLARAYSRYFSSSVLSKADITNSKEIRHAIQESRPDVVINVAAKTRGAQHNSTRGCEESPELIEITRKVNSEGAGLVAQECSGLGIYLVHLSTGSIFQGDNHGDGFREDDTPTPIGHYAQMKVEGEQRVLRANAGAVLRIQMPVSGQPHQRNLITKLENAQDIMSIRTSITVVPDLLYATRCVIEQRLMGIYHVVNSPATNPIEIMCWYCSLVNPRHPFKNVSHQEAMRRGYYDCVLSTTKLEAKGIVLPSTEQAVKACLEEYRRVRR
jgi:dTDP-4-dehydrorhamnose reductase